MYDGFKDDEAVQGKSVAVKTTNEEGEIIPANASLVEACRAARRVFSRVPFLFKQRAEILKLLGDPSIINDDNDTAKNDRNEPRSLCSRLVLEVGDTP